VERTLALWLPGLAQEGPRSAEARAFAETLGIVQQRCPFVTPIRLGLAALPARGPSRFYGGEEAVAALLASELEALAAASETEVRIGVADGLFASVMAARAQRIVAPGATGAFLAALPISVLRRPELAAICQRLGLPTLGRFAALDERRVLERFGSDGAHCHRVARGELGELHGIRDPHIARRLAALEEPPPSAAQPSFFGGSSLGAERAARAAIRAQQRLGSERVQVARLRAGHDPADRAELVPFGSEEPAALGAQAPWPGGLPAPSPVTVFAAQRPVRLTDAAGAPVGVSARGLLTGVPGRCTVEGDPRTVSIVAWAGPWPLTERWWDRRRAKARLQILTELGTGMLLAAERTGWQLVGRYD
jgi:nucleotidyltransferase/DNA polymerase involved in DNA repair